MDRIGERKMVTRTVSRIGLDPFGISPDPRFIYFDAKLRREHETLLSALRRGTGLVVVVGGRGIGKTMLLRSLAAELDIADHLVVYKSCLGSPSLDDVARVVGTQTDCSEQVERQHDGQGGASLSGIFDVLGVRGTPAILLLDDADSLAADALSGILALTRGGSKNGATLSVVLAGSSHLPSRLEGMRDPPLKQKIDLRVSLTPLEPRDVDSYITHRLQIAGCGETEIFAPEAIERIAHYAHGNPQAVNRICRAAMVIAADQSRETISADVVNQVAPGGGGGRTPETKRVRHERPPPPVGEDPGKGGESDATASSLHQDILSHSEYIGPAFALAVPDEPLARTDLYMAVGGASRPIYQVMPSGRDPTSQVSLDAYASQQSRARVPVGVKWASLGVLSAIGAVALYLVVAGETADTSSVSSEIPSTTKIQGGQVETSRTRSLNASSPRQWVEPPRNDSSYSPKSLDPVPFVGEPHDSAQPRIRAGNLSGEVIDPVAEPTGLTSSAVDDQPPTLPKPRNTGVTSVERQDRVPSATQHPTVFGDNTRAIKRSDDPGISTHDEQVESGAAPTPSTAAQAEVHHPEADALELGTQSNPDKARRLPNASEQTFQALDLSRLVANGDHLLSLGDVASARLVYRLAAVNGSAIAATSMGSTYDPIYLEKAGIQKTRPSPTDAIKWYKKAITMGEKSAEIRLRDLTASLERPSAFGDRGAKRTPPSSSN